MDELLTLPGVEQVTPFHFYDPSHKPTRCDLLVHRTHHWAIATEREEKGNVGLVLCLTTLATAVCTNYALDPQKLVLLNRYAYGQTESYYTLHFAHFDRDLFAGLRFLEGRRQSIHPVDVPAMLTMLTEGNELVSVLRALHLFAKPT